MNISGIGQLDRERITKLLRATKHTISIEEAANILSISKSYAAKLLALWATKGWMSRIEHGVYISVPLESETPDLPLEDPWIIAEKLYNPCYIAGLSAGEYWNFTEQLFRTVVVFTAKPIKNRTPSIGKTDFLLHVIPQTAMFGLKSIWRGQIRVKISDPTRTILDFLINPKFAGGIIHCIDMFQEYLKSEHKNLTLLIDYAKQLDNSAVFKRFGFLLERYAPEELKTIEICKSQLTISKTKLDPEQSESNKLITRWRLWVPQSLAI